MCTPKTPKIKVNEPAPPPPKPEESAAYRQGSPELQVGNQRSQSNGIRNKLRIDRNKNEDTTFRRTAVR